MTSSDAPIPTTPGSPADQAETPGASAGDASATPPRRLSRSTADRMVGGVCGGIAGYLGVDATLVRLAVVVLALAAGNGVLLYVAAWLLMPDGDGSSIAGEWYARRAARHAPQHAA